MLKIYESRIFGRNSYGIASLLSAILGFGVGFLMLGVFFAIFCMLLFGLAGGVFYAIIAEEVFMFRDQRMAAAIGDKNAIFAIVEIEDVRSILAKSFNAYRQSTIKMDQLEQEIAAINKLRDSAKDADEIRALDQRIAALISSSTSRSPAGFHFDGIEFPSLDGLIERVQTSIAAYRSDSATQFARNRLTSEQRKSVIDRLDTIKQELNADLIQCLHNQHSISQRLETLSGTDMECVG